MFGHGKKTIYKKEGTLFLRDQKGAKIIENYERYIPNIEATTTWTSFGCIVLGIALILIVDFL